MRNVGIAILVTGLLAFSNLARAEFASRYDRMVTIEDRHCFVTPQPATERMLLDCRGPIYLTDADGFVKIALTMYRIVYEDGAYRAIEVDEDPDRNEGDGDGEGAGDR